MESTPKGAAALVAPTPLLPYPQTQDEPFVEAPTPKPQATVAQPAKATVAPRRTQIKLPSLGPGVQAAAGILLILALGGLLWLADGYFTLVFLRGWTGRLASLGLGQWLLPALVTLGQLYFWPRKAKWAEMWEARGLWLDSPQDVRLARRSQRARSKLLTHLVLFLLITAFNVGTSSQGFYEWANGRTINMFGGFTLPSAGTSLRWLSVVAGAITAFGPEKLWSWARNEWNDL